MLGRLNYLSLQLILSISLDERRRREGSEGKLKVFQHIVKILLVHFKSSEAIGDFDTYIGEVRSNEC